MSGMATCAKPEVNAAAEVPDAAGHMLVLEKATCTWSTPWEVAGVKAKSAVDADVGEMHGGSGTGHGYSTTTLENGDKVVVRYEGTMHMAKDGSGTFSGTWHFVRGTGKAHGITGGGTYKGKGAADGTGSYEVEGSYTLAAGKTAGAKH
jgi:hypothetical protein